MTYFLGVFFTATAGSPLPSATQHRVLHTAITEKSSLEWLLSLISVLACLLRCDKHHGQKQLGEEKGFLACRLQSIIERSWGRSSRNQWKHKLVPRFTSRYISYAARTHLPRDGTTHKGVHTPHPLQQLAIKKMSPQTRPQPVWWRQLLSWRSLFLEYQAVSQC